MSFIFEIKQYLNCYVISLRGKIITDTDIDSLLFSVDELIKNSNSKLVFNLFELTHINSSGINLFMKVLTKTRVNNGDLIFYGVNGNVGNLFKIAKLNGIYTIFDSLEEALNHFKNN
jgi:anti-sigma B factor antagonist